MKYLLYERIFICTVKNVLMNFHFRPKTYVELVTCTAGGTA